MTTYNNLISTLSQYHISSPRLEARLLLAHILNISSDDAKILTITLSEEQQVHLQQLVHKRTIEHFPLDKILGIKGFYKYEFYVNEDVLSPRPDTEILVEQAVKLNHNQISHILDLGTGSGCILLSLLKENPQSMGVGIDTSPLALQVAQKNSISLGVDNRVKFINANWFDDDFISNFKQKFDIIVTNPPYIPDADIPTLDNEVKNHDPYLALSGGADGYDSYRRIAELSSFLLQDEGYILLEGGIGQADTIAQLFINKGFKLEKIVKDLSGIERCIILKK